MSVRRRVVFGEVAVVGDRGEKEIEEREWECTGSRRKREFEGFGGVFTHRCSLCKDMPYLGCWAWRRVGVPAHMRSIGRICVENRGVFGLGVEWVKCVDTFGWEYEMKCGVWVSHAYATLRICVGVSLVCKKMDWARLVAREVGVMGGTHMRGGHAYAWGARAWFTRFRLSCYVLPRLYLS
ncbi:hypothetical protein PIB30_097494 [Stylosanthes scabra]|uniref:Uncharacterized protein n=1 Tax=Stylosanthes scabra TaxID=79078 RepID=A0ABU6VW18_9FABA|nr:hypothetical protein [Stylosanthes scabra]